MKPRQPVEAPKLQCPGANSSLGPAGWDGEK
jgi:hypothetical protein